MADKHPEIRAELNELEEGINRYAMAHQKPLSEATKARILDRIKEEQAVGGSDTRFGPTAGGSRIWTLVLSVLSIALLAGIVFLFIKFSAAESELAETSEEFELLRLACDEQEEEIEELRSVLRILRDAGNQAVVMEGTISPYYLPCSPKLRPTGRSEGEPTAYCLLPTNPTVPSLSSMR